MKKSSERLLINTCSTNWKHRRSKVMEAWNASGGSASARSIATIVSRDSGVKMGRWLAGKLMNALDIASCQVPAHKYKHGGNEHVEIPNHLDREFAVNAPDQVWCGDVTYIWTGKCWAYLALVLGLFAHKPVGWAMSTGTHGQSVADARSSNRRDVPQRPGESLYQS